jgi:glycerate dehydrogenase
MNIVVLDGFALNPGDLDWTKLEELGRCTVYDRTAETEIVRRAADAEIALTNKTPLRREHLERLPVLQYVGVLATGYNIVDTEFARTRGVTVTNVPAYSTRSVAQLTFALLLELALRVGHHSRTVREGRWSANPDFCYWDFPLVELNQLTMGIVGFGRIGHAVAELAGAFGMQILIHTRTPPDRLPTAAAFVDLETLFRQSDVVTLHCPLVPATERMVNAERLAWMRPSAFLLNTSRGQLVDEQALAQALNSGAIAGAGLDVLSVEPPPASNPLLSAKNCIITPHFAWATRAARVRLMEIAVANVRAFLSGKPQNVVKEHAS